MFMSVLESGLRVYKGISVMKTKIQSPKEQGQAIVEMCVCLIPILVIMLGMIFISGLGISNIRAFIEAKGNAELASRLQGAIGGAGDNIYFWDYGDPNENGDGYPFTDDDEIVNFYQADSDYSTEAIMYSQLNESVYSQSQSAALSTAEQYIYLPTASLPHVSNNFSQGPPETMLDAANLVQGKADSNFNETYFIDPDDFSGDGSGSFNVFGIDLEGIDLRNMRANTVYFPALAPEVTN